MKKTLLLLFILSFIYLVSNAQVTNIRPASAHRGQTLTTVITVANGVFSLATPPQNYNDIYLQQGSTIIYTYNSYYPWNNVYGFPPNFYSDSLHTDFTIPANAPIGYYDVKVVSYIGATPDTNVLVNGFRIRDYDGSIEGDVYFDANQNGVRDSGEVPMINHQVHIAPSGQTVFTDVHGHYKVYLDSGLYIISYLPPLNFTQTSVPPTYHPTIPPSDTGLSFGTYSSQLSGDTQLFSVWHHPMRCNTHGYTYIDLTNNGLLIQQGNITMIHSNNMPFFGSTPPPDIISGDTLKWYYNNLLPGQHIRIGNSSYITFSDPAAGQTIWYTTIDSIVDIIGAPLSQQTDSFGFVVTCSCDPNEKEVIPQGIQSSHYVDMHSELVYTVNFQNTGTDTAFDVIIFDTLDANLDLNTFEVTASSDPVDVQLSTAGELRFAFMNILLPDSNIDEPGSHGFVTFRIKPDSSLPDPTAIHNRAHIIFDFNSAIVTNRTTSTLTTRHYPYAAFSTPITTLCSNNSCINFTNYSQNGTSYQWIFPGAVPDTSQVVNPQNICFQTIGAFAITLITTNVNGNDTMTIPDYIHVIPAPAIPTFATDGDTIFATPGHASYQWYLDSTIINGATGEYYVALQNGSYQVLVSDSNGCQSSAEIPNYILGVSYAIRGTGGISAYPNPTHGSFEIKFNSPKVCPAILEMINATGQKVYSREIAIISGENMIHLTDMHLSPGIYSLKINDGNNMWITNVVIEKQE